MRTSVLLVFVACLINFTACSPPEEPTLFERLKAGETGVTFENRLTESEQWNILAYEYYYNGGGVAVGDFNNDGKPDLYFTGNQVANAFYLNKGNFQFEDITQQAGLAGRTDGWATGVTVADVNADGFLDIYVCYSGPLPADKRKNQLFINNKNLTFTDHAEAYGLADTGYSTQAAFLDYDRDGDLDLFVMNHNLRNYGRKEAAFLKSARDPDAGDKLYRNDTPKDSPNAIRFTEVSEQAGIRSNALGFGLGLAVSDLNHDGWPDLFVGNDYVEEDYVYINQRDGTFLEAGKDLMGHFSFSTMGVDIADVNNDTWPDVFTLDMLPADNERQKLLAWPDSWNVQQSMLENGFHWQNMRNMLHLNRGVSEQEKGMVHQPSFSEIGQLAGVAATDWSWGGLLADLDNDGLKDIFVSNGYVRDYTNLDFIKYYADEKMKQGGTGSLLKHLAKMPATPTHHFIFKNNGDLTFTDKSKEWGFDKPAIACGSAYADLDGDGDLDLITNATNETAGIYKNTQQETNPRTFLDVELGHSAVHLGAKVALYPSDSVVQWLENYPTRGFESSSAGRLHFGLNTAQSIDSVQVLWPDGRIQILKNPEVNQVLSLNIEAASQPGNILLTDASSVLTFVSGPEFFHRENAVVDFNRQILLPRQYSYEGPRLAKADVNGDGREDFFVAGATGQPGALFIQKPDAGFVLLPQSVFEEDKALEDRDAVFLDADGDGDFDLYVVSGSFELAPFDPRQEDRLYLNDGKGHFSKAPMGSLPGFLRSSSCVVALDADRDGDTDLFVGGAASPGEFPYAAESFLLINNGKGRFTAQEPLAPLGLVTDVCTADINGDGWPDLLVVGEWMPITYILNQKGTFDFTQKNIVSGTDGLWLRVTSADLDGDGDADFVAGNWGLNNPFRNVSAQQPLTLYANDFDRNGTVDPFMSYYMQDKEYPQAGRDEALEQYLPFRKKFTDYASYARATFSELFSEEELNNADKRSVSNLQTGLILNEKGTLTFKALPLVAQQFPVAAILVDDFDGDGLKDIFLAGNLRNTRIRIGKMDAGHGLLLTGTGKGTFEPLQKRKLGVELQGEIKDVKKVGTTWIVAQNNGPMIFLKQR
ncbi:VCBS repeat-containing protein [Arundinibacter roseus]|uniref:RNA-binding protein n=1 Tax=Arundinibacter roseus TaxID=2070510 RepID=A0A4R4JYP0_9BACT|nr:VCBS repeat-containing protein [Arundinibacter roseus]TDB59853.1 RNA-binding protein [Arundinibacter roseus]